MVASAFSSGYQNDAPTRWLLITVVVVIVVVVVVVIVIVVLIIVVVIPPAASRSRGDFHVEIPYRSRLEIPRCRKYQWLPWRLVGSSLATVVHLQNNGVRLLLRQ